MPTNIAFLTAVLDDSDFRAGRVTTSFIEDHPGLLAPRISADRGTKLLTYLADVTVNRPHGNPPRLVDPAEKLPRADLGSPPPGGSRQRLRALGPEEFARKLRGQAALAVTDTTFRDAHQSLLATRVRSRDLLAVAGHVARSVPELLSLEAWGGATYDVALRYLHEDPWERLAALSEAVPNICLQMLLRGRNTVGYTPYPETVTEVFVGRRPPPAVCHIFRIFDALNDVNQMRAAIDAVPQHRHRRRRGSAVLHRGPVGPGRSGSTPWTTTCGWPSRSSAPARDILAIKDMAGLLRPSAAATLVTALRERFDLPVHLHTHDTAGGQLATLLAAWQAGADAIDGAVRLHGRHDQPATAVGDRRRHRPHRPGYRPEPAGRQRPEPYWEAVRRLYAPLSPACPRRRVASTPTRFPAASCPTCVSRPSHWAWASGSRTWKTPTPPPTSSSAGSSRVTPSSKAVGDLALQLVGTGVSSDDFATTPANTTCPTRS